MILNYHELVTHRCRYTKVKCRTNIALISHRHWIVVRLQMAAFTYRYQTGACQLTLSNTRSYYDQGRNSLPHYRTTLYYREYAYSEHNVVTQLRATHISLSSTYEKVA